jgi:hypothetical protein
VLGWVRRRLEADEAWERGGSSHTDVIYVQVFLWQLPAALLRSQFPNARAEQCLDGNIQCLWVLNHHAYCGRHHPCLIGSLRHLAEMLVSPNLSQQRVAFRFHGTHQSRGNECLFLVSQHKRTTASRCGFPESSALRNV